MLTPLSNSTLMDLLYATEDSSLCMCHLYIYPYLGLLGSPSLLFSLAPLTPHTVNLSLAFSTSELDSEGGPLCQLSLNIILKSFSTCAN